MLAGPRRHDFVSVYYTGQVPARSPQLLAGTAQPSVRARPRPERSTNPRSIPCMGKCMGPRTSSWEPGSPSNYSKPHSISASQASLDRKASLQSNSPSPTPSPAHSPEAQPQSHHTLFLCGGLLSFLHIYPVIQPHLRAGSF